MVGVIKKQHLAAGSIATVSQHLQFRLLVLTNPFNMVGQIDTSAFDLSGNDSGVHNGTVGIIANTS